jgi:four helix bundle protein
MTAIRNHEDLIFWQLTEKLRERVFAFVATSAVAKHEDFCDDIRRSSRRAPAVISEGFYRFRPKDNANFVRMALGSLGETKNHLKEALKEKYIDENEFRVCWRLAARAVGAGNRYHAYLRSCPPDGPHSFYDPSTHHAKRPGADAASVEEIELGFESERGPNPNPNPEPEPVEPDEPFEPS